MITREQAIKTYPETGLLIGNEYRTGQKRPKTPVYYPSTNDVLGDCVMALDMDIEDAINAAEQGFLVWRQTPAIQRSRILQKIAAALRNRSDFLAGLICLELGKPYKEAFDEVEQAAGMFEWASEETKRCYGRVIPSREPGALQMALREPIGPIAAFSSWNSPLNTPARKISGALGAGCSIILKASEETPACALSIGRIACECGLPHGVLSIVFGDPLMISGKLMDSDIIRGVTFTGSTTVGKLLSAKAAATMKRTIMELGGHAPVIVFDDIDMARTIQGAVASKFRNSGQICVSPTRFLVQRKIYQRFVKEFARTVDELVLGDPFDPKTTMGPLANNGRMNEMEAFVEDVRRRGHRIITGGGPLKSKGNFFMPTVLADVNDDARVSRVEPFGPIAAISAFDTVDEALARANSLPLGLASYVMTNNIQKAQRCISEIQAGNVIVNAWRASRPETPFGGHRESGLGIEGGIEGIAAFQNIKFVYQA